ncbi:MAG: flagellar biosynthetic protein FliR [Rhizobiales bacterium 32-66-8]|nr:MAG: flagellar biosynthetic protein FliR [Rhizobiales bacterium 32-66-8]
MTAFTSASVLAAFLVFCRIGGCLMLMPGVGGRHLPLQIRLFLAIAISLAFVPMLYQGMEELARKADVASFVTMILAEVMTGATIGLLVRIYFLALQSMATAIAQAIGVATMPGISVDDDEQLPTIATLFAFTAMTLMFISDQHLELIRGLFESYGRIPPGALFAIRFALTDILDQLTAAFLLALRIASPFILYSILVNFAVGIINKFTPQIPVYFIATPFLTAGGMFLLYSTMDQLLTNFLMAFSQWLKAG